MEACNLVSLQRSPIRHPSSNHRRNWNWMVLLYLSHQLHSCLHSLPQRWNRCFWINLRKMQVDSGFSFCLDLDYLSSLSNCWHLNVWRLEHSYKMHYYDPNDYKDEQISLCFWGVCIHCRVSQNLHNRFDSIWRFLTSNFEFLGHHLQNSWTLLYPKGLIEIKRRQWLSPNHQFLGPSSTNIPRRLSRFPILHRRSIYALRHLVHLVLRHSFHHHDPLQLFDC